MSSNVTAAVPAPVPAAAAAVGAPAAAAPAAPSIAVAPSQVLGVTQGQVLAARVIAAGAGQVELALAGGVLTAASDLPMEPGATVRLQVAQTGADRVTLRVMPEGAPGAAALGAGGPGGVPVPVSSATALAQAGVPSGAAGSLLSALADAGVEVPPGAPAAALAARAAAAGVSTPAQAAAFARLDAAGLPATPASVAGLAQLLEGAPLGRTLTALADALAARTGTPSQGPAPATGLMNVVLNTERPAAAIPGVQPDPGTSLLRSPTPRSFDQPPGTVPGANAQAGLTAAEADGPETSLRSLATALATLTGDVGADATQGSAQALRRALADLGVNLEHRLHSGEIPERAPLRALLQALADHPGVDVAVARAAAGAADGIAAQALAGASLPLPAAAQGAAAQAADPSAQNGAYLQLPLPGGGTAEVRIHPDGGGDGRDGGDRPRKVAFLLHLSALGPVMIEATAGPAGVDATVRTTGEAARAFLGERSGELAESLRRASRSASVSVERMGGPPPERLLEPPPSSGVDVSA